MVTREQRLNAAFVALTDTLVHDFDVTDLLYRLAGTCVDVLGGDEAGILISDGNGTLRVVGSSSEELRLLELFEVQNEEGPCLDAFRNGQVIRSADLEAEGNWPRFQRRALEVGFRSVDAVPLRLRDTTIGALNILRHDPGGLGDADLSASQALADVATIALVQERTLAESQEIARHLRRALDGQVAVEQAKGMVAARTGLQVGEAFQRIRQYARHGNHRIVDVAEAILAGRLDTSHLDTPFR